MGSALYMWKEFLLTETRTREEESIILSSKAHAFGKGHPALLCMAFTYAIKDSAAVPAGDVNSLADHASASPSSSSPSETSSPSIRRCFCRC